MEIKRKLIKKVNSVRAKEKRSFFETLLVYSYELYGGLKSFLFRKISPQNELKLKSLERKVTGSQYAFVSVDNLVSWTEEWIRDGSLSEFDLIVAVPRSGLVVGSIVATTLAKPLTTPELCSELVWKSRHMKGSSNTYNNILLLDDSINSGETLSKQVQLVKNAFPQASITKAALIASPDSKELVDRFYKIVPRPRLFEWSMLHSKKGTLAVDMDGVLCSDPKVGLRHHEPLYVEWMQNVKPYLVPSFEIDFIISNREEKFRPIVENWLKLHGIKYKVLALQEGNIGDGRRKVDHKIQELLEFKPDMFWESSPSESVQIWKDTKIPTLCIVNKNLFS